MAADLKLAGPLQSMKYECLYLHAFETGSETRHGIARWMGHLFGRGLRRTLPDRANRWGAEESGIFFTTVVSDRLACVSHHISSRGGGDRCGCEENRVRYNMNNALTLAIVKPFPVSGFRQARTKIARR